MRGSDGEGPLSPLDWQAEVFHLDGYRSILQAPEERRTNYGLVAHHPIPKQVIRDRGLPDRVWDPRNGVTLRDEEHQRHESGAARVPYERLPQRCKDFAEELGPWAEDRLLRAHPSSARKEEV